MVLWHQLVADKPLVHLDEACWPPVHSLVADTTWSNGVRDSEVVTCQMHALH